MSEMQQIINLKNTIADIHQQGLNTADQLRNADSDHHDRLWISLYDFIDLALHTRTSKNGAGNAVLLSIVNRKPEDEITNVMLHVLRKLDRILALPVKEVVPFLHTTVTNYCRDLVRRKKPDLIELDQPIGDGSSTLIDLICDEHSDFLAAMVEADLDAEQHESARNVVLRLLALMPVKPGVVSALLSRLMGLKPREMVADMRASGVANTICRYVNSVCRTTEISGREARALMRAMPNWRKIRQQLHTESSDAECAMQISRLCHRHRALLRPDMAA